MARPDTVPSSVIDVVSTRRFGSCNLCVYGEQPEPQTVIQVAFKTGHQSTTSVRYCDKHFREMIAELNRLAEPLLNPPPPPMFTVDVGAMWLGEPEERRNPRCQSCWCALLPRVERRVGWRMAVRYESGGHCVYVCGDCYEKLAARGLAPH